ncbi:hypothetical protein HNV08_12680 [Winogradskyella eckloniae]|uniref:hypothetical protein n=1 Tax=Winogradskyella eckloniae TaxID=1089306 RepID=UPI001565C50A|nr:hypothetical protein [Winogradskyella eckloniae]NRD20904.1 hypothetical protein [Winogradskyella eckloniae]
MKLYYTYLFIFLLSLSCQNSEKDIITNKFKETTIETPLITDEFKLNFLNEILSNKEDDYLYPYSSKNPYLMFHSYNYTGNTDIKYLKLLGKPSTFPEVINHFFKENDTTFIINQIKENQVLDVFKLSKYGHNIVDWSKIRYYDDNFKEVRLVSKDSILKLETDNEKEGQLILYKPIFNKKLNKSYISMGYFMSHGYELLYKKENNKWVLDKTVGGYQN